MWLYRMIYIYIYYSYPYIIVYTHIKHTEMLPSCLHPLTRIMATERYSSQRLLGRPRYVHGTSRSAAPRISSILGHRIAIRCTNTITKNYCNLSVSIYLSIYLSLCLYLSIYLSISISIYLSIYLYIYIHIYIHIHIFMLMYMVQDVGGLQIFIHRSEKIMPFDRNQFEIFRDRKSI